MGLDTSSDHFVVTQGHLLSLCAHKASLDLSVNAYPLVVRAMRQETVRRGRRATEAGGSRNQPVLLRTAPG
jgi:hypothetical protein